jgi:hypothetical protein
MAHFACINQENIVIDVIVISNDVLINDSGVEDEQKGIDFCKSLYGQDTRWVQTSYNKTFRGEFAGIGFLYNQDLNQFECPYERIQPQLINNQEQ